MLETTWFVLWGMLWAVYFILDGFDLGLGTLLPFLAGNDTERRVIYNAMGPFWDGNEVWLITAGGVTFAAFPRTYAVMFSSLYSALMLVLFALIVRAVAFEFRGKLANPGWKMLWDTCLMVGSFVPALLFGVAFANIFQGIPIDGNGVYYGTLLTLLNPYAVLGGLFFLFLFLVHGSLWLVVKSEAEQQQRAEALAKNLWPMLVVAAVVFLISTAFATRLYHNYFQHPLLWLILAVAVGGLLAARIFMASGAWWKAWAASSLTIGAATMFGIAGLFPNLLPSSLDTPYSLTIHNSASSPLTLKIMLGVALVFIPLVVAYQVWVYVLFREKVTDKDLVY